jgi:ribonuclease HI
MKQVTLVTDGSCLGNPGPGGWACVLRFGDKTKELCGYEARTTNNRMEIMAAIRGLAALKEECLVELTTDSQYLKNGVTKWMAGWKRKNWRKADGKPVLNKDLWTELETQLSRHKIEWRWTKGHADHEDNNRCDELANRAAREQSADC